MEYAIFSFSNCDDSKRIALKSSTMHKNNSRSGDVLRLLGRLWQDGTVPAQVKTTSRLLR